MGNYGISFGAGVLELHLHAMAIERIDILTIFLLEISCLGGKYYNILFSLIHFWWLI